MLGWLGSIPAVRFERYADDAVVHCASKQQAERLIVGSRTQDGRGRAAAAPGQDADRLLQGRQTAARLRAHLFTFLGFTLPRPRGAEQDRCQLHRLPARDQPGALNQMSSEVRRCGSTCSPDHTRRPRAKDEPDRARLDALLRRRSTGQCWIPSWPRVNAYLMRWIRRKYDGCGLPRRPSPGWQRITRQQPGLFAHWAWKATPW